jgi:abi-like protein
MAKPFKSLRTQLKILRKRNVIIRNGSKAIDILSRENYYCLINGYKRIFIDEPETKKRNDDWYKEGTTFENIYCLYEFDRDLRNIVLKYILKAEQSIKAKVSYFFSLEHSKESFSYFNINNYQHNNYSQATRLISQLSNVANKHSDVNDLYSPFPHYFREHQELPLWVLITKMTFGETATLFYNMPDSLKITIIQKFIKEFRNHSSFPLIHFAKQHIKDFNNLLNALNRFRNICAHEDRLFDYKAVNSNGKFINVSYFYYPSSVSRVYDGHVFDLILILRFFLTKRDYLKLIQVLSKRIDKLSEELSQATFNKILIEMGFPKNWNDVLHSAK